MKRRWYLTPLYLIFLFACAVIIAWATTGTFGLDAGGGAYGAANRIYGMRFQNTVGTGILTKLEILVHSIVVPGNYRLGVYADSTGTPGSRLLDAGEVAAAEGWISISGLSLSVTADLYYWLTYTQAQANNTYYQDPGPANSMAYKDATYGVLPNPFPADPTYGTAQYVMRATVTTTNGSSMINNVLIIIGDEKRK